MNESTERRLLQELLHGIGHAICTINNLCIG